jgi:hypothetical protein
VLCFENSSYYRQRASELRNQAASARDEECRADLLELAARYLRMADNVEGWHHNPEDAAGVDELPARPTESKFPN